MRFPPRLLCFCEQTTMSDSPQNLPGSSTPTSRKRSKWDAVTDEEETELARLRNIIKKRPKIKNIRVHEPDEPSRNPQEVASASTSNSKPHSRFVPPRTSHPPLMSSRSVYSYERLNQIEEGSYGVVFRARDRQTGDVVALKKLKLDEEKYGFPITALREINALIACKHENVVGIREVVVGETLTQCVSCYFLFCANEGASHRDLHIINFAP